uniref:Uracil phosphoribosyltransferase n=1 Tax=Chondria sp. (in: red algae) TaxID=1982705 RepID=A0A1Z1MRA2_9FLOR|nr:uracil phosphoribosyltransferase [Chondria sp. (in: red algae)]
MQLNIYSISHPIIKILSNVTKQEEQNPIASSYYYRNIGLLLIYEVLRKYIVIKQVYIKCLYSTKLLNLVDNNEKYIILTNLYDNYEMITDIKTLLPNIDIVDISNNNGTNSPININQMVENMEHLQIFILKKELRNKNISEIIKYLTSEKNIPLNNIHIACIITSQNILTNLSYEYPKLKIYTTEIVYN